jgi:hypothetical protein
MTALSAIATAKEAEIDLWLEGDTLCLRAATQPPDDVLDMIRSNKVEIIRLLRAASLS